MFRFPSLQSLLVGSLGVVKRFPLEVLASIVGTVMAILLTKNEDLYTDEQIQVLARVLLCSILALTLFLSASVFAEQQELNRKYSLLLKLLAIGFIVAIFFLVHPIDAYTNVFRYGFLFVAFHLLVSFAPFIRSSNVPAFWEYNKQLFIRILTAGLYSTVLFAGLCTAIASTNVLFDLDLDSKIYPYLGYCVYGIFNTAFFLAGVPADWIKIQTEHSYPKGLKVFTQFVLIPLAIIYLAILLAYEGKVIIEWSLPKGLVSSLVLGYAVYGILSILLVHPIRHDEGNKWIKAFARLFYFLLIPLIILLVVAVLARVSEYGITEPRYILIVLSVWLTGITAYFLLSSSQNIKMIPLSLCLVTLLCIWGPQSASAVSFHSQMNRLIAFFEKHKAFQNGKFLQLDESKKSNDGWEVTSFIVDQYGARAFRDYLDVNLDSLLYPADTIKISYRREDERVSIIKNYLGLRYESESSSKYNSYHYNAQDNDDEYVTNRVSISGYDSLKEFYYSDYNHSDSVFGWIPEKQGFTYARNGKELISFDLHEIVTLVMADSIDSGYLIKEDETKKAKLVIEYISVSQSDSSGVTLATLSGYLLLKND